MKIAKCAIASLSVALAAVAAHAEPDATAHNLAAQCAAKNGTFDAASMQCTEPTEDSAAGDLVVGPMMRGLAPEAQEPGASDGTGQ
jgi:hypothetical protein